jgi:hypothetical protein
MRTTLTIDDDVASRLRPLLAKGKPKKVLNDLLRKALEIQAQPNPELPVFNLGLRAGIDPLSLNKLAEYEALGADSERLRS